MKGLLILSVLIITVSCSIIDTVNEAKNRADNRYEYRNVIDNMVPGDAPTTDSEKITNAETDGCYTIPISVSNLTNCDQFGCTALFTANINLLYLESSHSCVLFTMGNSSTIKTSTVRVDLAIARAEWEPSLTLLYGTDDDKPSYNTWCDASEKPGSLNKCTSESSCADLPEIGDASFCVCKRSAASDKHWYSINPGTYVCNNICFQMHYRYKVFQIGQPVVSYTLMTAVDRADPKVINWDGLGSPVVRSDNVTVTILNAHTPPTPALGKYAIFDRRVPFDVYFSDDVNPPGQYDPSKIGWMQIPVSGGGFKKNDALIRNFISAKVEDCHKDRATVTFSGFNIATFLENKRLAKDSLRQKFPEAHFYDQNVYFLNDQQSSLFRTASHLVNDINFDYEVPASGGFEKSLGYFIKFDSELTGTDEESSVNPYIFIRAEPANCIFGPDSESGFLTTNMTIHAYDCQNNVITIMCFVDARFPGVFGDRHGWAKAHENGTIDTHIFSAKGADDSCLSLNTVTYAQSFPPQIKEHSLHIPFPRGVQLTAQIAGKFTGIEFLSSKVCPDIQYCSTNDTYITLYARSTCGNGDAMVVSSDPASVISQSASLLTIYQPVYVARYINMTGNVTFGLCWKDTCKYCNTKLNYQKTVNFEEFDPNLDDDDTPVDEELHYNPFSGVNFKFPSGLSWIDKMRIIFLRIAYYTALTLGAIIVLILVFWILKCTLRRKIKEKWSVLRSKFRRSAPTAVTVNGKKSSMSEIFSKKFQ